MNTVTRNAAAEIHSKASALATKHGTSYREAFNTIAQHDPELVERYAFGNAVKSYDASPARRRMNELLSDPAKAQKLASWAVDRLARERIINVHTLNPREQYKQALVEVARKFPNLWRASRDGFLRDNDFETLGLLLPAIQGAVERGDYRHDSMRCRCGENKAYCRGKKLAARRGVSENAVAEFAACVRDAQEFGTELDRLMCYFK